MSIRILVPLDGSSLSEQALPAVRKFASHVGACSIELLYVIDSTTLADLAVGKVLPPSYLIRAQEEAAHYLEQQAQPLASSAVEVRKLVSIGPPAAVILDRIQAGEFDYVFMATHGRSGLARAMIGSVTDRVIREAAIPVIAVHPRASATADDPWPGDDAPAERLISLFARRDLLSAQAVEVLVGRGTTAVPELLKALSSHSSDVRHFAARALGKIGDESALDALVKCLEDDSFEVRWEAEEALVQFGGPGVKAVLEAIVHAVPDERVNRAMLHVLDRAPMELWAVLKPVVQAMRSPESSLAGPLAAAKVLSQFRQHAQPMPTLA